MRLLARLIILLVMGAGLESGSGAAQAEGLPTSLRPVARNAAVHDSVAQSSAPLGNSQPGKAQATKSTPGTKPFRLFGALRPKERSPQIEAQGRKKQAARKKGAICGDLAIQGTKIGPVGGPGACGIDQAVRVRSVSGVALSTHAVMDCKTAKTLKTWVDKGMSPAVGRRGGGVQSVRVVAHYACRTRNSQKGAKLSEHAKGRAIDIAGFTLQDGSKISVLNGWGTKGDGPVLRKMHASACGPFGTVLGPNANRFHRDHFHFDTARYRSGSYCR